MNKKKLRERGDLLSLLNEEILFLDHSATLFDVGFQCEAKRLATTIRVLLHDTKDSNGNSLFTQMGIKGIKFIDTSWEFDEKTIFPYLGLVYIGIYENEIDYSPLLSESLFVREKSFNEWWEIDPVFYIPKSRKKLTRSQIIRNLANKEGGAHVDPYVESALQEMNKEMNEICKEEILKTDKEIEKKFETRYDFAVARQITHELLLMVLREEFPTLPEYQMIPAKKEYKMIFGNLGVSKRE